MSNSGVRGTAITDFGTLYVETLHDSRDNTWLAYITYKRCSSLGLLVVEIGTEMHAVLTRYRVRTCPTRHASLSTTMSSKVVPTVHIDPDTDALASTSIAGSPLATVRIEEPSLHNTRESPLATARIEEPSRNDTAGGTEAAQTITAVSAISGLGLGFGLESDGGAGARTNGSAPARHGVRLVDALSTSNSQDIQQWQHGASDTAGKSAAGGGCRDQQCREDSSGGLGNGERSTEHPRSSSVGDGADNSAMSPTSSAAKFAADGHGERTSTHGAQNDIEVAANLARVGSPLTSRANAADDDSRGKHGTGASHLKLKTVAHLPGMMGREHIASYAEEHEADVSAEINSLSKVRRWAVCIGTVANLRK